MAAENSFDIACKVDMQEVANAVNQTKREVETRYDLKGTKNEIALEKTELVLSSPDDMKLRTCFIARHVCDGGEMGCRSRRRARSNMSILRGLPTKRCAQIAPSLRVAARTVVCCVTLLDHIDICPSSGALHTVRPGRNASRAWL